MQASAYCRLAATRCRKLVLSVPASCEAVTPLTDVRPRRRHSSVLFFSDAVSDHMVTCNTRPAVDTQPIPAASDIQPRLLTAGVLNIGHQPVPSSRFEGFFYTFTLASDDGAMLLFPTSTDTNDPNIIINDSGAGLHTLL